MSIATFPAASGGGIKLVQHGQAVSAGNITITAVDTTKTFVRTFSEGSSGTVALSGNTTGTLSPSGGALMAFGSTGCDYPSGGGFPSYSGTRTVSGGTTDATVKLFGAYLSNSTTLVATGACRYEIVESA